MQVKCVCTTNNDLTFGKIYIGEYMNIKGKKSIRVVNNKGIIKNYSRSKFQPINSKIEVYVLDENNIILEQRTEYQQPNFLSLYL